MKPIYSNRLLRLLRKVCPPQLYEGIEGDLLEAFEQDVKDIGLRKAESRFTLNVLRFMRPGILLRNSLSWNLADFTMLRNYAVVAIRNIARNKIHSLINILGLTLGISACLVITKFVIYELSFDKFHKNYLNVYRVINDRYQNGTIIQHGTITYPAVGPAMAKDFPEIESNTRLMPASDLTIKADKGIFTGDHGYFADERFLSIFTFPLVAGQSANVLSEPHTAVLTESLAKKYFDVSNADYTSALGKVLYWGTDRQPFRVAGVCKDVPSNSHLQFDILFSYATLITPENQGPDNSWTWSDMYHYVLLKPGTNHQSLVEKFDDFSERYFHGEKVSGSVEKFYLQPLSETHLYSDFEYDFAKKANGKLIWSLAVVATLVLTMALINYVNLTTSRALDRAKEVGVRKVMGAVRLQIIKQFTFESILLCFVAFIAALISLQLVSPLVSPIVGSDTNWLSIFSNLSAETSLIIVSATTVGILLAGILPATMLSAFRPGTVLKGKFLNSTKGTVLRKCLVSLQFMIAAVMITGTAVVSRQLQFMNDADLGIEVGNTIVIQPPARTPWDSTYIERVESYKNELKQVKGVVSAAVSNLAPGARLGRVFNVHSRKSTQSNVMLSFMAVDDQYFDAYDIKLVAGRKFKRTDFSAEWSVLSNVVITTNAVRQLGIPDEEVVGSEITFWNKNWTVVGVVSDFHQESLKNPKEPMVFVPAYNEGSVTSIKLLPEYMSSLLEIENIFHKFFPDNAFEYFFLKEKIDAQYKDDVRFSNIINIFTFLAIIISLLGLTGLSSHAAAQRTKEIGIRKTLGATVIHIVTLLSGDFMKVIAVAIILSVPISWYTIQEWLEGYAYHISPGLLAFVVPVLIILLIALITIGLQVFKTARTNPAKTLKHE